MPSEGKKGPLSHGPKKGAKEGDRSIRTRKGGSTGVKKKGKG